jgi:Icc-related predicted phosphoesterase
MRMLFVADLHYSLRQFDWLAKTAAHFELVVIGGDLLDLASSLDIDAQIAVVEMYLQKIGAQTRLLVSSGNHDGDERSEANESVARWLQEARAAEVFVDGDSVDVGETLITVCPWWDGPASRAELEALLARDAAREKTHWLWIHHAPPDQSPVSWTGRKFAGDEFLPGWIRQYQPDAVLSGHIHNAPFHAAGSWIDRIGKTWVFNPGHQIGPCPAFIALDLETMQAEWSSLEGVMSQSLSEELAAR